jgi:hypothetical protein
MVLGHIRAPRSAGRGGVAALVVSTLQSLFAHAVRLGIIAANPAGGVRMLAGKKKGRGLSVAEIRKLGETIRSANGTVSTRSRWPPCASRF